MNKVLKTIISIIVVLLIVVLVGGIFAGNYFYTIAVDSKSDKEYVTDAPHNSLSNEADEAAIQKRNKERADWLENVGYTDKYMESEDGLKLHAYEIMNTDKTDKWVILCHGYAGNAKQMIGFAQKFYDLGFNIIMPDARGLGESEGDYIGMGWPERRDIVNWSQGVVSLDSGAQIVLYGVSMGAATVMMTSGEADLPTNVKVVIEDSGYTSVHDEFAYQLKEMFGLPAFPILNFSSLVTRVRAGYSFGEASAVKQVSKSITPTLFIHGDSDTFVPSKMIEDVYAVANVPKEKLVVEGAGHVESSSVDNVTYWRTIEKFISEYIE